LLDLGHAAVGLDLLVAVVFDVGGVGEPSGASYGGEQQDRQHHGQYPVAEPPAALGPAGRAATEIEPVHGGAVVRFARPC
jgi:hypothetical protein